MKYLCAVILFLITAVQTVCSEESDMQGYAGSESCRKCHEEIYNRFIDSGHPFKIRNADLAEAAGFPLPAGYTWDDVFYVIGGETKKIRYIDQTGFIITTGKYGTPAPTQYNIKTGRWVNYHPGKKKAYKCGPCHMTGYKKEGNQHGRAGMIGTWAMDGIQCEACHGPSSLHTINPEKIRPVINRSPSACGVCHVRGKPSEIPAKAGFIKHHEQYNELLCGSHKEQKCVDCHDPHAKIQAGIRADCASCHKKISEKYYQKNIHGKNKIRCIECHMPYASKSAESYDNYIADVRTHLFHISTDEGYEMFSDDGKYSKSELSVDFACLPCHRSRTKKWASLNAKGNHK